jgi:hypothetical protein
VAEHLREVADLLSGERDLFGIAPSSPDLRVV